MANAPHGCNGVKACGTCVSPPNPGPGVALINPLTGKVHEQRRASGEAGTGHPWESGIDLLPGHP